MTAIPWVPFREPMRTTLTRTLAIAIVGGTVLTLVSGVPRRWPVFTLLMLWPAFGGHWIELWFLNWLRPRLPETPGVQFLSRIAVWFAGGLLLGLGVALTARVLMPSRPVHWPAWWTSGVLFIAIELVAHMGLRLRGRPSFYDGRG